MDKIWKKYMPKKVNDKFFSLSREDEIELARRVSKLSVEWHGTTPRKFACERGCFLCCSMCWFSYSELLRLPLKYHDGLMGDGMHVQQTDEGKCIFFKEEDTSYQCTIRKYRPLRCRIYPFHPILDTERGSIVILSQDVMMWGGEAHQEPANLCYGLGHGKDVSNKFSKLCKDYLIASILEKSESRFLWMGKTEDFIDRRALKLRLSPIYTTFQQCHQARLTKAREVGFDRFKELVYNGEI